MTSWVCTSGTSQVAIQGRTPKKKWTPELPSPIDGFPPGMSLPLAGGVSALRVRNAVDATILCSVFIFNSRK